MTTGQSFVIVGASLAGAKAAQALREEGFDGRLTLIGEELHRPYERPPLSKEYLQGKYDREKVFVHPVGWYAEQAVDLRLGTAVTDVDPAAQQVLLGSGHRIGYDRLLLTTGSTPRRLMIPGAELQGVHYLRSIEDSEQIRAAFTQASRVAIIGAGWIGLETAAAARLAGLEVILLETAELPLLRILGPEVAEIFADLHRKNGVDLRTGAEVTEFSGRGGSVTGVRLADGRVVSADLVIVGVGVVPNDMLARNANLDVDHGITVNEHMCTSDAHIYAAGDVANAYHPRLGQHVRVEHWANARRQGVVAAKSMLGHNAVFDRPPYFFSDQYDFGLEYTGHLGPAGYDTVVLRGEPSSGEFVAFWLRNGRVLAGMNVNTWNVTEPIEQLILSGRFPDLKRLADPDTPLYEL